MVFIIRRYPRFSIIIKIRLFLKFIIDLTRLTDTGSKIILLNNQIENDWMRVKSLNVSSLNRAYAKFLYFILQDNEEAFSILERFSYEFI